MPKATPPYLLTVTASLRKLGADIRTARIRHRLPIDLLAMRAGVSRGTLHRVEKGEPTVAIGIYANVLMILGLIEGLKVLAEKDPIGREIEAGGKSKRVRLPRR